MPGGSHLRCPLGYEAASAPTNQRACYNNSWLICIVLAIPRPEVSQESLIEESKLIRKVNLHLPLLNATFKSAFSN